MRVFFQRLGYKIASFTYGRYGIDALSKLLLILALILMVTIFVVKVANKRKFGRIDYYT